MSRMKIDLEDRRSIQLHSLECISTKKLSLKHDWPSFDRGGQKNTQSRSLECVSTKRLSLKRNRPSYNREERRNIIIDYKYIILKNV